MELMPLGDVTINIVSVPVKDEDLIDKNSTVLRPIYFEFVEKQSLWYKIKQYFKKEN
jgi:hypothetical protein